MARPRKQKPIKLLRKRLEVAGVEAHFAELAADARELEIRVKDAEAGMSEAAPTELDDVQRRLLAGEILAVQIRFFEDDAWWCDTVMRAPDGSYRLVRMRQLGPDSAP